MIFAKGSSLKLVNWKNRPRAHFSWSIRFVTFSTEGTLPFLGIATWRISSKNLKKILSDGFTIYVTRKSDGFTIYLTGKYLFNLLLTGTIREMRSQFRSWWMWLRNYWVGNWQEWARYGLRNDPRSWFIPPMKLVIRGMIYGAGFTTIIFGLFFSMRNPPWESIERRCPISGDPVLGMTFRGILGRLGHLRSSCMNRNPRGATSVCGCVWK